MSDLSYIDSYFNGELSPEQTGDFEQKIQGDPVFAGEVAFYCTVMHAMKDQLAADKKKRFRELYEAGKFHTKKDQRPLVKKIWPYIAAAVVVTGLIVGWLLYAKPASTQKLADEYIKQHFRSEIGVKMAGEADSVDAAIRLYNENKFSEALQQFEMIIQQGSNNDKALKMAGIVSLRLGEYDKAVEYFTQLENLSLYSNPGKFYHAIALIKRNQAGDKEMAKQLLKQVIDQGLEEKETAQKWIKSF